jgi:hypothetical protein
MATETPRIVLVESSTPTEALLAKPGTYIDKRWAFLSLQFFYAASALIGLARWST